MNDLSIVILSFNTKDLTINCLKSIVKYTKNIEYEIVVLDNNSNDGSSEAIKALKLSKLKLIQSKRNLGFALGNNEAIKHTNGRYILFLNSDTKMSQNTMGEMVPWMDKNPKIGISSCQLLNPNMSVQGTGGYFPTLLSVFSWMTIQDLPYVDSIIKPFHPVKAKFKSDTSFFSKERSVDWLTGAFLLVRKSVMDDVKGFDPDFFMYTEDVDFCFRAKKYNWDVYFTPKWSVTHYGGASSKVGYSILKEYEGVKLFYKKHYAKWKFIFLRLLLRIGALGRIVLFGLLDGKESAKIYAKAFKSA